MPLPLPKVVYDVEPGGGIVTAQKGMNALQKAELENQYYAPNIQSEIDYRNALSKGQNIHNQYLPQEYQLANQLNQQKFDWNPRNWAAENALKQQQTNEIQQLLPGRVNELNQKNQMYIPATQADISYKNAQTNESTSMLPYKIQEIKEKNEAYPELTKAQIFNYRNGGRSGMGVGQKEIAGLQAQLQMDHPDWDSNKTNQAASAYLTGDNAFPNGEPLPPLSGLARTTISQIQKRSSTAAIQNQAANMDVLASDLNNIDISPLKRFAGFKGRADYATYATDMALGKDVPQEFRDYETFKNITSNFSMDALRKGFGTSVVPGYVYATLGKAANPASTWWHDPKQVENDWNATKKWINENAKKYKTKSNFGATADVSSNTDVNKNSGSNSSAVTKKSKWIPGVGVVSQ